MSGNLASREDLGLHPLFLFIDEVHILFGDEQVGGKTGRATPSASTVSV